MAIEDKPKLSVCFEPITIAKSLEEGVADLIESSQREEQEACWLYDSGIWHNLSSEAVEGVRADGYKEIGIVQNLPPSVQGRKALHYHTHPRTFLERDAQDALDKILAQYQMPPKAVEGLRRTLRKGSYVIQGLPSFGDFKTYLDLILEAGAEKMDFFVVSPMLVSQMKIDPEKAEELADSRAEEKYKELQIEEVQLSEQKLRKYQFHPVINLAEDLCKKINQGISGIELTVRTYPGNLAYLL